MSFPLQLPARRLRLNREVSWRCRHWCAVALVGLVVLAAAAWDGRRSAAGGAAVGAGQPGFDGAFTVRVTADGQVRVRAGAEQEGGALTLKTSSVRRGKRELRPAEVHEEVRPLAAGAEQRWRFFERPEGGGDLEVRIEVGGGLAQRSREGGARLRPHGSAQALRYGAATWIDARGVRSPVSVRVCPTQLTLLVPSDLVDASVFPAVLDPLISVELALDPTTQQNSASGAQRVASIATNGSNAFVAWEDYRLVSGPIIMGSRVAADGTVLDPTGIAISSGASDHSSPAVAFDGVNYLVVWSERRGNDFGIFGARVAADGAVLDPEGFVVDDSPGDQLTPSLASDGVVSLVVWAGANGAYRDLSAVRIAAGASAPLETTPFFVCDVAGAQEAPAVAAGGGVFLVVWMDGRRGAVVDLYAARVDPSGAVLEPNGRVVSATGGQAEAPAVAAGATGFVVAWSDRRNPWPAVNDVYAARVTFAGAVVDLGGRPINQAQGMDFVTSIGFDGTNFLINRHRTQVLGGEPFAAVATRVAPDLSVVGPAVIALATNAYTNYTPRVAFLDGHGLIVWEVQAAGVGASPHLYVNRLANGATAWAGPDRLVSASAPTQDSPAIAYGGALGLVAWRDSRAGAVGIHGHLVGPEPSLAGAASIVLARPGGTDEAGGPTVASDGVDYVVAWSDWSGSVGEVRLSRVNRDGGVLDPGGVVVASGPGRRSHPRLCFDGSGYLAVWSDERDGHVDIYGARVTREARVIDPNGFPIAANANPKDRAALAFDGEQFLVAWSEVSASSSFVEILSRRVARDGGVMDAAPIVISRGDASRTAVALAYEAPVYLAVWQEAVDGGQAIEAARVTPKGALLDASGVRLSSGAASTQGPDVVGDGEHFVVVWPQVAAESWDLHGVRVAVDGGVVREAGNSEAQWVAAATDPEEVQPRLAASRRGSAVVVYSRFRPEAPVGARQVMMRGLDGRQGPPDDGGAASAAPRQLRLALGCGCAGSPDLTLGLELSWAAVLFARRRRRSR